MRRLWIPFVVVGLLAGGCVLWLTIRVKDVHAIASLPPSSAVFPGGERNPGPLVLEYCHPDVSGWFLSFTTAETTRREIREWYDGRFGPRDLRLSDGNKTIVYDDITVRFGQPWETNPLVQVFAYRTTSHICPGRRAELWDIGPSSTHKIGSWMYVDNTPYAPAQPVTTETNPPDGWTVRRMRLVEASVASSFAQPEMIWVQRDDDPWQAYSTEFVYYRD